MRNVDDDYAVDRGDECPYWFIFKVVVIVLVIMLVLTKGMI